jgi:hypothetical protein
MRFAKSQRIKVVHVAQIVVVYFVDRKYNGEFGLAQKRAHEVVVGCKPRLSVNDVKDSVGSVHRDFHLRANVIPHHVVAFKFQSARIDERKRSSAPLAICVNSVARNAGSVLDDGDSLPREPIEQRRFSDVRSSYNCHQWFHIFHRFRFLSIVFCNINAFFLRQIVYFSLFKMLDYFLRRIAS